LQWAAHFKLLDRFPALAAYLQRISARPAAARALA
jgi:glutathione S-transferase